MNNVFMKVAGRTSRLITALASINVGLAPFDYNVFQTEFFMSRPELVAPVCYIILAAGVVSLAHFVMVLMGYCGGGCSACKCK